MSAVFDAADNVVKQHLGDTFPACSICVVHRHRYVMHAAWGWVDPETQKIKATTETYFDLASLTKLFTSMAFLTLVSQGAVGLDDPLVKVVPEFGALAPRPVEGGQDPHTKARQPVEPAYAGQRVDPSRVTFRHLLTHTSGLAPWRDVFNAAGAAPLPPTEEDPMPRSLRWARALEAICGYPFVGQPDGVVRYSDLGIMLLGEAVARLHGEDDLVPAVQERVLRRIYPRRPLYYNPMQNGIPREQIAPTENDPTWRKRRVWGEVHDENACGVGGVAGHAGLFGTAQSVADFGEHCLDMPRSFGLSAALRDEVLTLQAESDDQRRGLGFAFKAPEESSAGDLMGSRTFGHTGFTGTSLWIDPDARLVIACMTNSVYPGREYPGTFEFRRAVHDAIFAACDN
ncbi:MAG: beta-lactamase family protein [Anaerolineae bacterium]|nr:beta-lactamase family protein [Anaerolineae bacterium]